MLPVNDDVLSPIWSITVYLATAMKQARLSMANECIEENEYW